MKVLALDLGTKTGWCFGSTQNGGCDLSSNNHGVHDMTKSANDPGLRFLKFHNWFRAMVKSERPDAVYFEDVKRHVSNLSARVYCGLLSQAQLICYAEKVELVGVGVGTIKKHATGKGNAPKESMIEAAKNYGLNPVDDNDADAICLWHYARFDL